MWRFSDPGSSRWLCNPSTAEWLTQINPQIIYVNVGLLDAYPEGNGLHTAPDLYRKNLETFIATALASTKAMLIWGTIPPVDPVVEHKHYGANARVRQEGDIVAYNAIVKTVMRINRIPVVDTHARLVENGVNNMMSEDGYHLNHYGHECMAILVSNKIKELRDDHAVNSGVHAQGYVVPDTCAPVVDAPLTVPNPTQQK